MARLEHARLVHAFAGLRTDPARFALASYLLELLGRLAPGGGAPADLKRLFEFAVAALRAVDAGTPDAKLRAFLELRALHALGLCPELARCVRCGRALAGGGRVGFHVGEGGPLCASCGAGAEGVLPIHLGTLRSLERGLQLDLDRLGRLALGPVTLGEACELLARFQRFHLGIELRSQRFLDGILTGNPPPAA
jgi:DNA repair protein RecO (recombination protein O)